MLERVPLKKIRLDGGTQSRKGLNNDHVADCADAYRHRPEDVPPLEVVFDGSDYWPWDGFHRYFGAEKAGLKCVPCCVRKGTVSDARWLAASANQKHFGLKRSNEDKRFAAEIALKEHPEFTDVALAEHVGVDDKTIAAARARLESRSEIPTSNARTGRDGRTYDTSHVGKKRAKTRADARSDSPSPDDSAAAPTHNAFESKPAEHHAGTNGFAGHAHAPAAPTAADEPEDELAGEPEVLETPATAPLPKPAGKKRAEKQEEVLDRLGRQVPPRLRDVFADDAVPGEAARVRSWLEVVKFKAVVSAISRRTSAYPYVAAAKVQEHLEEAHDLIRGAAEYIEQNLPYAVCPACGGAGKVADSQCPACRCGCGYLPKWRHDELKREAKA